MKHFLLCSLLLGSIGFAHAQLDVTTGYTAMQLAEELVGTGIEIVGAELDCPSLASGIFDCIDCNLGIDSGFVLTTGRATNAEGPNNSGSLGYNNGASGDPDLNALPGVGTTYDACVLEIDIIPECDTVSFDYAFGSEEYNEFVGSINDAFAFWISGPGIVGAVNIALIPGTTLPVTIDNVNLTSYSEYYNNNTGVPAGDPYYIQYDGFTTVLTAISAVIPGETYHLKLAIGDEADHIYDSGVFLKANSLSTTVSAGFTFPETGFGTGSLFCTTGTDPEPEFGADGVPGEFTATPDGLVIDAATGTIDLSASEPGTYTVYNTVIADGCAIDTLVAFSVIEINDPPIAEFSYDGSPFCNDLGSVPIILGPDASSGTFTASPGGLSISVASGTINTVASTPGTYTVTNTLASGGGCPSITHSTSITIAPLYDIIQDVAICDGDAYILPDGSSVSVAGSYTVTLPSADACDSTVTTNISILPVFDVSVDASLCDGDSYMLPDGISVTAGGIYTSTLSSASGCDSIIHTTLEILPIPETSVEAFICDGDFFTLPDGTVTSSGGTYTSVLTAASGCDSLVFTTLELWPVYAVNVDAGICEGTTYTLPDGTIVGGGFYSTTLISVHGCDSIIYTNVEELLVTYATVDAEICDNDEYLLPDGTIATESGTYVSEYTTVFGCDSVITTNLVVHPNPEIIFDLPAVTCFEEGAITLVASPAGGAFSGANVTGAVFDVQTAGVGGPYAINYTFTDGNGCTSDITMFIEVDANNAEAYGSAEMIIGYSTPIYGNTGGDYNWSPADWVACAQCDSTTASPPASGTIVLTSYNENGCVASDEIYITVLPDPEDYSFIPNSFTPNGDLINDYFTAFGLNLVTIRSMRIYDRWGNIVYEQQNIPAADITYGWDGSVRGTPGASGVYSYVMELEFIEGDTRIEIGNVTLLR
jgi:gliding motility-associated-like protein